MAGNLEVMHRVSWRLLAGLVLTAFFVSPAEAKTKVLTDNAPTSRLVSGETHELTPAEAEKAAAEKKEKEKKYALLDPSEEDEKAPGKVENVTGEVGAHNNFGLAVELPSDPKTGAGREAWFNFTSKTKWNGVGSPKELQDGDTVTVIYKETDTGKRILKGITLVAKKPKEAPAPEAVDLPTVKP